MTSVLTVGYDPQRVNTSAPGLDSMTAHLWNYEGTLDSAGKVLTLETEGPCPGKPGITKFKEVTGFKSKDHRVFDP